MLLSQSAQLCTKSIVTMHGYHGKVLFHWSKIFLTLGIMTFFVIYIKFFIRTDGLVAMKPLLHYGFE